MFPRYDMHIVMCLKHSDVQPPHTSVLSGVKGSVCSHEPLWRYESRTKFEYCQRLFKEYFHVVNVRNRLLCYYYIKIT